MTVSDRRSITGVLYSGAPLACARKALRGPRGCARLVEPPEEFTQLELSLLNYGLPDLATVNIADIEKKRNFTRHLEKILRDYEPRFKTVKVNHIDNKDNTDRTLRFRIDATLYADPAPEVVVFDSVLDPVSRTVNVEESKHG